MSPRSEKEEMLNALSKRIFSAMLDEIILDVTLQAHREVLRGKAVCKVCHTKCGSVHVSGLSSHQTGATTAQTQASGSQAGTPSSDPQQPGTSSSKPLNSTNGNGNGPGTPGASTGTVTPSNAKDGTLLLECIVCQRQIASNRYAPHLSSCMGLSSARRGPTRTNSNANIKPKLPSDTGRSASPASEAGTAGSDNLSTKGKGKAKPKPRPEENEVPTLKRKRPGSPQTSPNKVTKKAKASGSPVSRVKAEPDAIGPLTSHFPSATANSKSKVPSKLRESSTTSFLAAERSPSVRSQTHSQSRSRSSRSSSPAGTPASSAAFSAATQSPNISSRTINVTNGSNVNTNSTGRGRGRPPGRGTATGTATGTGPPTRRMVSPPRPASAPGPTTLPLGNVRHHHHVSVVQDYGMNDGDETGSSTDTDSD